MHVVAVGTFDVGHAAPRRNERGDAYVALESVMRAHAKGGGFEGGMGRAARSTKRKLSGRTKRNGGGARRRQEGDKRNVKSKKQKGRRNKSAAREREPGGGGDGRGRDTAGR